MGTMTVPRPQRSRRQTGTVVVFSGGPRPPEIVLASIPAGARVVAADRGAAHALRLGLRVEVAVGDFDSLGVAGLARLEREGIRIERHPTSKDATDLELALEVAVALGPRRLLVVGSSGGRLDHLTSTLLLLGADRFADFEVDALLGEARLHVIRGRRRIEGSPGELVSLLALHGDAEGLRTRGLLYPLEDETLAAGSSRGVSNVLVRPKAEISLRRGVLLAVFPGSRAAPSELRSSPGNAAAGSASS
jgi:thiamine pyrophosphokinase